jgi:hypothetical protein
VDGQTTPLTASFWRCQRRDAASIRRQQGLSEVNLGAAWAVLACQSRMALFQHRQIFFAPSWLQLAKLARQNIAAKALPTRRCNMPPLFIAPLIPHGFAFSYP